MSSTPGSHLAVAVLSRTSVADPLFVEVVPSATRMLAEKLGLKITSGARGVGGRGEAPHELVLSPPTVSRSWMPSLAVLGGITSSRHGGSRDTRYAAWIPGLPAAVALSEQDILSQAHHYATAEWRHHSAAALRPHTQGNGRDPGVPWDGEWAVRDSAVDSVAASLQRSRDDLGDGSTLDDLNWRMEREELQLRGVMHMIQRGGLRIDPRDLDLSFGYHQGVEHTTLCFHDTSAEVLRVFLPQNISASLGSKVLCPYGTAAVVGVAHDSSLDGPCMFWHPAGSPAALAAPVFHSCRLLSVGQCAMEPHGPAPRSPLLLPEELSRYLNVAAGDGVDGLDRTTWINVGLFGRPVGTTVTTELHLSHHPSAAAASAVACGQVVCTRKLTVVGTRWNRARNSLEQLASDDRSGELVRLAIL